MDIRTKSHSQAPSEEEICGKHYLVIKHTDVLLGVQTVSNIFESMKHFVMFDQMFDVVQIVWNTIKQGAYTEKCLVAKQCLIGIGVATLTG